MQSREDTHLSSLKLCGADFRLIASPGMCEDYISSKSNVHVKKNQTF